MLNKRAVLILFLFLVSICAISAVSANDSADEVVTNVSADEMGLGYDLNDLNGYEVEINDDEDVLQSTDDGTFTALQNKLNNADEGSTVYLDNDYSYNTNFGSTQGVEISKSLTINGRGHVIDGLSASYFFKIRDADKIVLKDISFKNGVRNTNFELINNVGSVEINSCNFTDCIGINGGAVFITMTRTSSIVNCNFKSNYAKYSGGALALMNVGFSSIVGCTFEDNAGAYYAGALALDNVTTSSIESCSFKKNSARIVDGGAAYLVYVSNSDIKNCNFIHNSALVGAGALLIDSADVSSIEGCIFDDNYARVGGALLLEYSYNLSTVSCQFINNAASNTAGAVYSQYLENSSFIGCKFDNNSVSNGNAGGIFFENIVYASLNSCNFTNQVSYAAGGVVYVGNVYDFQADSCNFFNSLGNLGGVFFCLNSAMKLKSLNAYNSTSYGFGGVIAANGSDVSIDKCIFTKSHSMTDSGGIIYIVKSDLDIKDSSFIQGGANYGGAIANLESNLTVSGSRFINNAANAFGGAIYSVYGRLNVDNSLFNGSNADVGSAISCMMSYSLSFTNNVFLNSTGAISAIDCIYSAGEVIESGNHFEDVYHVSVDYMTLVNGEETVIESKTLDYVATNTGTYLNNYGILNPEGDYKEYPTIDFANFTANSKIFGNYNTLFKPKYFYRDNSTEIGTVLVLYHIYDDAGLLVYGFDFYEMYMFLFRGQTTSYDFNVAMFDNYNSINHDSGSFDEPVSLINSVPSEISGIPSAYDSRNYGYITSVEDQGTAGNCWAFAGIATLEACIKKATGLSCDYSEENVKNLMAMYSVVGLNLNTNNGGYDSMIMAYLTSWRGPINELSDSYSSYSVLSSFYKPLLYVQNIKFLPQRKNSQDNDFIKRAIMDYGAVSITFNWPGSGYHAVSLVGWNDNYNNVDSLGNYAKGAWIFKNSWGPDWGDNGFGYLSYDTRLTSDINAFCHAYTFVFNKNDSYLVNHQYDNAGVSDYLCNEGHIFYKNKFVCNAYSEDLAAFSTYFKYPTSYKVSVYKNDELVLSQSGYSDAGYYTIPFNKKISVEYGDEYVIQIENCNPGDNCFPVCQANELTQANFKAGTSFVSFDGVNWLDLYNLEGYYEFLYGGVKPNTHQVACIKVFRSIAEYLDANISVTRFDSVDVGEEVSIHITVNVEDVNRAKSIDGSLMCVNINGKDYYAVIHGNLAVLSPSFDEGGTYKLSAQYKNNLYQSNIVEYNFKVNKLNTAISASSVSKVYGGGENSVVTLRDDKGNLVRDAVITFDVGGKATKIKTNANGQATIPISLAPKTYIATVSFDGSGKYNGASTKINIVVKKVSSKITAKKVTLKAKKTKKYTIVLKDSYGNAIKKVSVVLKVKGKTFKAKTLNNGKATFKLKLPKKGSFKATIKFAGNAYYNAATKKVKITVKR